MNIYVGNLAFNVSEDELRDTFEAFGAVESVKIIKDRMTGESRGFGFVEMQVSLEGETAIREMDGKEFKGRKLVVNEARPRTENSRGGGGGRSGGGGFRGGRGGSGGGRDRDRDGGGRGGNRRF
ncbi:MAG: RNA-binding protein [Calditrichaeota bacterium]|nr:RNA-binding protein [Calditrichota bacterium]MCB0267996.1 RNA-binding protein [Calditrichota bacterium]MCB0288070.1 RNA-binding protein [Calditrichota bacterium]MCB0300135.1 RNA-binding protein [Calditrichota bacterium]MCB9066301.1 RNA-binding protein [Calditrichia bacterium]